MKDLEFIITKEIDVMTFQAGIFVLEASMLCPVAVYPEVQFQSLKAFHNEQMQHPKEWMVYAGPAGIGQYSLRRKTPAGLLARFDVYFRYPTKEEMEDDFQHFGEQVLGPLVADVPKSEREQYKGNTKFKLWGENHYFTGPPRIVKSMFLTKVFKGELPKQIDHLIKEVDDAAEKDEMIVAQGYQFLHATDGKMLYLPFNKSEDYNPSKLELFGFVEINDKSMTYYPRGDRNHPIDYTAVTHQ